MKRLVLSIPVKLNPSKEQIDLLDGFCEDYRALYSKSVSYLDEKKKGYEKIKSASGSCSICKKERTLEYQKEGKKICRYCLKNALDKFTVQKPLVQELRKEYPDFSERDTIYYNPLYDAIGGYQSFLSKDFDREKKLRDMEEQLKVAIKEVSADYTAFGGRPSIDWEHWKELEGLKKGYNVPSGKGLKVKLWKGLHFKNEEIIIDHPRNKGQKIRVSFKAGEYQLRFIREGVKKNWVKEVYSSINKLEGVYFLQFPYRRDCNVFEGEELLEHVKREKPIVAVLSFGLSKTVTGSLFKEGEFIESRSFGGNSLYEKRKYLDELDKAVIKKIISRHGQSKKADTQKAKWWKKTKHSRQAALDDLSHNISFQLTDYLEKKGVSVVVMRDYNRIKGLKLPTPLARALSKWSVGTLQTQITYKSEMRDISVYCLPYKEVTTLTCSCGYQDTKKILTSTLKRIETFKCPKCSTEQDFHMLDTINLYHKFQNHLSHTTERASAQESAS